MMSGDAQLTFITQFQEPWQSRIRHTPTKRIMEDLSEKQNCLTDHTYNTVWPKVHHDKILQ